MNLQNLLAVQDGALEPHMLLGMQVLFTIPEKAVESERLTNAWQSEGLDQGLIPERRTLVNTAEAACRSVETRKGTNTDGARLIVKVDRVSTSPREETCVYQLTRQILDKANQVIEHEKGMTLTFKAKDHRAGLDPWTVQPWEPEHYLVMRDLEQEIRNHFTAHVGSVPGQKVRNAVREYLTRKDKLGGTNMRRHSGGVYFVPIEHAGTLDSLERVVKGLYDDDADFDMIPMANSQGVREIVEKHHRLNMKDDAGELVAEIANRLREHKKGGPRPRRDLLDRVVRQRIELGQHRKKMAELLGSEVAQVGHALELVDVQIEDLAAAVGA